MCPPQWPLLPHPCHPRNLRGFWLSFLSRGTRMWYVEIKTRHLFFMCSCHSKSIWKSIFSPPSSFSPECHFALNLIVPLWIPYFAKSGTFSMQHLVDMQIQQCHTVSWKCIHHQCASWLFKYFTHRTCDTLNNSQGLNFHLLFVHNSRMLSAVIDEGVGCWSTHWLFPCSSRWESRL